MSYINKELTLEKLREAAMTKFDWSEQIDVDDFDAVIEELSEADVVEMKEFNELLRVIRAQDGIAKFNLI